MNTYIREQAAKANQSLMDYILSQIKKQEEETGIKRTIFAACPNSLTVIRAALKAAKRCNAPIKFAATLNQVDIDRGYTGLNHREFVNTIRENARMLDVTSPVIIAIDHGGPWLKDKHNTEKWSYESTMAAVKKSFEAAVDAGYDLIHVDPTIDITLPKGQIISIEVVAERTIELIVHTEQYRHKKKLPKIAYEVGTEEVHGGLADLSVFNRFMTLLKAGLAANGLRDVWPCFVVGKVGTDLHTTTFDPVVARQLTKIAAQYGSVIKGHYSDNVSNPEEYPLSGMGAANIGPEFTEKEYEGLMELERIAQKLYAEGHLAKEISIKKPLWNAVIESGRWRKWLNNGESSTDFYSNAPDRQEWLIKTGCRYIWENPEVVAARARLYDALSRQGIKAEEIVEMKIEHAMDKYFFKFNLTDLNEVLLPQMVENS